MGLIRRHGKVGLEVASPQRNRPVERGCARGLHHWPSELVHRASDSSVHQTLRCVELTAGYSLIFHVCFVIRGRLPLNQPTLGPLNRTVRVYLRTHYIFRSFKFGGRAKRRRHILLNTTHIHIKIPEHIGKRRAHFPCVSIDECGHHLTGLKRHIYAFARDTLRGWVLVQHIVAQARQVALGKPPR